MSKVLAALDTTASARPVLETALLVGELIASDVESVHVRTEALEALETLESLALHHGVPLVIFEDPIGPPLLAAAADPEVAAVVIGARSTPGGRRPIGRIANHVLQHADKPVVVVPPDVVHRHGLRRLLLPLEGTDESSLPVLEQLVPLLVPEIELLVLHVFTAETMPPMLDRPGRDLFILEREFLARHLPQATQVEFRAGPVATRVAEVCEEQGAALVVLSWSQDMSAGRAEVVREVLNHSVLPVLLLPVARARSRIPIGGG